jgi:hypothetical protein
MTSEPRISSYFDIKTGVEKFRIFIAYGALNKEPKQNMFSKGYVSHAQANKYGCILRDCLELQGDVTCLNRKWDDCRAFEPHELNELTQQLNFQKSKLSLPNNRENVLVCSSSSCVTNTFVGDCLIQEIQEEQDRSLLWWDLNETAYLFNKRIAADIVISIKENAQFEVYSHKLYHNFLRRKQADFFMNMIDYIDPTTSESYFSFKTDLMGDIFSYNEVLSCKKQYMLTLSEPGINGKYMCTGMRRIIQNLPM